MEDKRIIELFFARAENAITELAFKYGKLLRSVAYNVLNNLEDTEECVNDTYFATWNTIPPKNPEKLAAYVVRITKNLALKKYEYNTAKKRCSIYDVSLTELEECLPDLSYDSDEDNNEYLTNVIEEFLNALDRKSRVMFVKRYWYSEAVSTLAAEFSMSENNVSVKLLRIRKGLKTHLEKRGVRI